MISYSEDLNIIYLHNMKQKHIGVPWIVVIMSFGSIVIWKLLWFCQKHGSLITSIMIKWFHSGIWPIVLPWHVWLCQHAQWHGNLIKLD
jgi:hypothetical protein